MVSGKWWLMTGIPILVNLREVAEANMEEFDTILRDGTASFAYRTHACKPA
jgi:MFS-type transporter involved in bile tolerance (Atg22 family)